MDRVPDLHTSYHPRLSLPTRSFFLVLFYLSFFFSFHFIHFGTDFLLAFVSGSRLTKTCLFISFLVRVPLIKILFSVSPF